MIFSLLRLFLIVYASQLTLLFNPSYPVSYSPCLLALPSCFKFACTLIPSIFSLASLSTFFFIFVVFIMGSLSVECFVHRPPFPMSTIIARPLLLTGHSFLNCNTIYSMPYDTYDTSYITRGFVRTARHVYRIVDSMICIS